MKEEEKDKKESDEVNEIANADDAMRNIITAFNHFIRDKTMIIDSKMRGEIEKVLNEKNSDCENIYSKLR